MTRGLPSTTAARVLAVALTCLMCVVAPVRAVAWQAYRTSSGSFPDIAVRDTASTSVGTTLYRIPLGLPGGVISDGVTTSGYVNLIGGNGTWLHVKYGNNPWGWSFDSGGGYDTYVFIGITALPGAGPSAPANGSYTSSRRPTLSWSAWDNEGGALSDMNIHVWKATGGDIANGSPGNVRSWAPGSDLSTGLYYWTVRPYSWINGWGGWFSNQSFFVDYTAPTTSSNAKTGYGGPATISISAADDAGGSGVAHTYYRLDSGPQTEGTGVSVSSVGSHSLEYWSVDVAGNAGSHTTKSFAVYPGPDTTRPHTSVSISSSYPGTATIALRPADNSGGCGVAKTYFAVDSGSSREGTRVVVTGLGTHRLVYWSIDNLGNVEAQHTSYVVITRPKVATPGLSASSTGLKVYGYVNRRYASGSTPVRIRAYYRSSLSKSWRYKWTVSDSVSNASDGRSYYSKFIRNASFTRGYWCFKAYTVADATHYSSAYSAYSKTALRR